MSRISQILECILHLYVNSSDILKRVNHITLQFRPMSPFLLAAMRPCKFRVNIAPFNTMRAGQKIRVGKQGSDSKIELYYGNLILTKNEFNLYYLNVNTFSI
jgi:hypothetical protein